MINLQVLPGRTHPLMNMSGSGGFLLHTIKVYVIVSLRIVLHLTWLHTSYDDPSASSVMAHRYKAKKAKLEGEVTGDPSVGAEESDMCLPNRSKSAEPSSTIPNSSDNNQMVS